MIRRIRNSRVGFTLIEILVVIAIIAVLAALITGAVMAVLGKGPDVQTRQDISGLSNAVMLFKKDFGGVIFPSRVLLSPNINDYTTNPYGPESQKALIRLWGRINMAQACTDLANPAFWGLTGPILLEGDQCLVFFLRGLNGTGFSADKTRPFASGGSRIGPWFDFPVAKLQVVSHVNLFPATSFPSFLDAYDKGRPYLYFASYGKTVGYHVPSPTDLGDCQSGGGTGTTVTPYIKSMNPAVFYEPDSFQIISAGKDGIFNPGGLWAPGMAQGGDDFTNFSQGMLIAE
jgi:prepilin-type N-terminal cleavage/methylation domain-containing protein